MRRDLSPGSESEQNRLATESSSSDMGSGSSGLTASVGETLSDAGQDASDLLNANTGSQGRIQNMKNQWNTFQGQAKDRIQTVSRRADPFIRERPYVALGLAAGAGFLLSSLLMPRRSR